MLIHASARNGVAAALPGDAQIVLSLDVQRQGVRIRAFCKGEVDSTYAELSAERVPAAVAALLAELRAQLSEA